MNTRVSLFPAAVCAAALLCAGASAQTPERRQGAQAPPPEPSPAAVSADPVANELSLLRKSLQTLNTRLREISDKLLAGGDAAKPGEAAAGDDRQKRIAQAMNLLTLAEQRAEVMRRQLLEMTEKETAYRNRLTQIDEDMRPDSIDRAVTIVGSVGSVRTPEIRDTRRRVLDNERKGVESLLSQASQSRARLEEDIRQADLLVARLRMRLLPLIEREIDKINPAQQ